MDTIRWSFHREEPDQWTRDLARLGAGPFQTVLGLRASGLTGSPVYFRCLDSGQKCIGVALGLLRRRRVALLKPELWFPTLPLWHGSRDSDLIIRSLVDVFGSLRARAAHFDSFDAQVPGIGTGEPSTMRREFRVPITDSAQQRSALSVSHRRKVSRGDRRGWRLERLTGREATATIAEVTQGAARRARRMGRDFDPAAGGWDPAESSPAGQNYYGGAVWAVKESAELLSAALVIWAGGRGFYVAGGSTPAGYASGAAPWMHIQVMKELGARGIEVYNLGGVSPGAEDPESPHHGLHRFKKAFGAEIVPVQGAHVSL